jgi:23S rRNA pseudouridine2605 synthase
MPEKIRLQKYLSQAWICSRRKGEEYIEKWLIKVNGEIATIGMSIDPTVDKVELAEAQIKASEKLVYYKLNKPRGIVTTCAQHDERSILDIVDIPERVFPIGRLDKDTTGLILLTNDGRLANYLMHPKYEHKKEYIVETFWPISDDELQRMSEGVFILWKLTNKSPITRYSSGSFSIILTEGRNRQIRRMVESVSHKVKKLKRIRIENIELWDLPIGRYVSLTKKELTDLGQHLWLELV